ncbi:MAG TPA: energy transducer TonB [Bacteroidia bacterium]|jgi:TonB family protein|nr:energy transducer TonB [Bacteroidia bacterium]
MKKVLLLFLTTCSLSLVHAQDTAKVPKISDNPGFTMKSVPPSFIGDMGKFLSDNLLYPKDAIDKKIHGQVLVSLVIENDGSVNDVKISQGVYPSIDSEAVRVVRLMPNWTIGTQNGHPVRVQFKLPINFILPKDSIVAPTKFQDLYESDDHIVFTGGLLVLFDPSIDLGFQLKNYFSTDPYCSNMGPGIGCEFNFGTNSGGVTFGPKVYYQLSKYWFTFGGFKSDLYVIAKLSFIYYTGAQGTGPRIVPEVGLSLYDAFEILYGYNIAFTHNFTEITGSRVTALITLGGKKHKTDTAPLNPLH